MAGTKAGGVKAAATNKQNMARTSIANSVVKVGVTGIPVASRLIQKLARIAGSIGGKISKRGKGKGEQKRRRKN